MSFWYESQGISVNWSGLNLSEGWGNDGFLSITPRATNQVEPNSGADGIYSFSKVADKGADIVMTFKQTAPIHAKIAAVAAAQGIVGASLPVAPFIVTDATGDSIKFVCIGAVLTTHPTENFGAQMGEKSWGWTCESYINAEDPATVASSLQQYYRLISNGGNSGGLTDAVSNLI